MPMVWMYSDETGWNNAWQRKGQSTFETGKIWTDMSIWIPFGSKLLTDDPQALVREHSEILLKKNKCHKPEDVLCREREREIERGGDQ